jgi:hypothetical protein
MLQQAPPARTAPVSSAEGQPAATLLERSLVGLHCGAVAALAVTVCFSSWLGRRFELLPLNHGAGPWVWLGAWLVLTVLIALPRRARLAWQVGLATCAVSLVLAAAAGAAQRVELATSVGAGALLLALGCAAIALGLREARAPAARRPAPTAGAAVSVRVSSQARGARGAAQGLREGLAAWAPWCLWLLIFGVCFVGAWKGVGDARAVGHTGMLVAFFVMLPGLSLRHWLERVAIAAWLLSGALLGMLGVRSERWSLLLLALLVAGNALLWLVQPRTSRAAVTIDEVAG